MEVLRFIFSSFWIWLGVLILIATAGNCVVEAIRAAKTRRKISAFNTGDRLHITIDGASKNDVAVALQYAKEGRWGLGDETE